MYHQVIESLSVNQQLVETDLMNPNTIGVLKEVEGLDSLRIILVAASNKGYHIIVML